MFTNFVIGVSLIQHDFSRSPSKINTELELLEVVKYFVIRYKSNVEIISEHYWVIKFYVWLNVSYTRFYREGKVDTWTE